MDMRHIDAASNASGGAGVFTKGTAQPKQYNRSSFDANSVSVNFPFQPYECQKTFVTKLLEALQKGQNALLESPTGTGKTLCLLTGALAWQQRYAVDVQRVNANHATLSTVLGGGVVEGSAGSGKLFLPKATIASGSQAKQERGLAGAFQLGGQLYTYADQAGSGLPRLPLGDILSGAPTGPTSLRSPVIIYASRTHSQLSQVVRELKASGYFPRMAVLGSRDALCVHPTVSKLSSGARNHACRALVKARRCMYRLKLDQVAQVGSVLDLPEAIDGTSPTATFGVPMPGAALDMGASEGTSSSAAPTAMMRGGPGLGSGGGSLGLGNRGTAGAGMAQSIGQASSAVDKLPIMDIEELAALGRSKQVCPFFLPRMDVVQKNAELLLVPYNYLLDPAVRQQSLGLVDLQGSVMIFDEAHNVEDTAAESSSFDLSAGTLADCITDLRRTLEPCVDLPGKPAEIDPETLPFNLSDALALLQKLIFLEKAIDEEPMGPFAANDPCKLPAEVKLEGKAMSGDYIYTLLAKEKVDISFKNKDYILELLDQVLQFMVSRDALVAGGGGKSSALEGIKTILERVFRDENTALEMMDLFRVVIYRPDAKPGGAGSGGGGLGAGHGVFQVTTRTGRTLAYWCFSPAICMGELQALGVRSVILASGTLAPMDSYAAELRAPFPIRLENKHVISQSQLYATVLTKGVSKEPLNSAYEHREKASYKRELGNTICNLLRVIPDGVLVFFPSYGVMESVISYWKGVGEGGPSSNSTSNSSSSGIWKTLESIKAPIVEPRAASDFAAAIQAFNYAVDGKTPSSSSTGSAGAGSGSSSTPSTASGAVMFAVCRGKVSEGLDFADARGRAVIVTGLPYPPIWDPKVALKRRFLDDAKQRAVELKKAKRLPADSPYGTLTGHAWYTLQAFRAVNQAIGRVIRHRNDYGAILLLDERFSNAHASISAWIRPYLTVTDTPGQVIRGLADFFRTAAVDAVIRSGQGGVPVIPVLRGLTSGTSEDPSNARAGSEGGVFAGARSSGAGVNASTSVGPGGRPGTSTAQGNSHGYSASAASSTTSGATQDPSGPLGRPVASSSSSFYVPDPALEARERALLQEIGKLRREEREADQRIPSLEAVGQAQYRQQQAGGQASKPMSLFAALSTRAQPVPPPVPAAAPPTATHSAAASSSVLPLPGAQQHEQRQAELQMKKAAPPAAALRAGFGLAMASALPPPPTMVAPAPVSAGSTGSVRAGTAPSADPAPPAVSRSKEYTRQLKAVLGHGRHSQLSEQLKGLQASMAPADGVQGAGPKAGVVRSETVRSLVSLLHSLLLDSGCPVSQVRAMLLGFLDFVPKGHRAAMQEFMEKLLDAPASHPETVSVAASRPPGKGAGGSLGAPQMSHAGLAGQGGQASTIADAWAAGLKRLAADGTAAKQAVPQHDAKRPREQ